MDIYANPELYEMFNLYLDVTNGSRHENMRESQAMKFLTNLDDGSTDWQSLEEVYGDTPAFQWWTSNGRKTGIGGFDTDFPWTIELLYDLTQKIVTNSEWDIPLEIDSHKHVSNLSSTNIQSFSPTVFGRPESLNQNGVIPTIQSDRKYVKLLVINEPERRVFNIIYFTLQPSEGWPKKVRKTPSLNHPRGIL